MPKVLKIQKRHIYWAAIPPGSRIFITLARLKNKYNSYSGGHTTGFCPGAPRGPRSFITTEILFSVRCEHTTGFFKITSYGVYGHHLHFYPSEEVEFGIILDWLLHPPEIAVMFYSCYKLTKNHRVVTCVVTYSLQSVQMFKTRRSRLKSFFSRPNKCKSVR